MTPEDIQMIDAGADSREMSFSDFITYCVRKELIGSNAVSPELLANLAENLTILQNTVENAKSLCYTLKNGAEYALSYGITETIKRQEEEDFKERLENWMKNAVSLIRTSSNPKNMSRSLIEEGISTFDLTDYGISILENCADPSIPVRD